MLPGLEIINIRRKELGLTQTQLADMAGVSQGYIAKIEGGRVDPSYPKVEAILDALDIFDEEDGFSASEVMNDNLVTVKTSATIPEAIEVMRSNGFSQLPVMLDNHIVGSIDEETIIAHLSTEDSNPADMMVEEIMYASFPKVGEEATLSLIGGLLKVYPAVLVQRHGDVKGIITKSDVLSLLQ